MVCVVGFEPTTSHFQGEPSDLADITHRLKLVVMVGLEPTIISV
jgi:hypothetical protein